jgi:hypothetical protein
VDHFQSGGWITFRAAGSGAGCWHPVSNWGRSHERGGGGQSDVREGTAGARPISGRAGRHWGMGPSVVWAAPHGARSRLPAPHDSCRGVGISLGHAAASRSTTMSGTRSPFARCDHGKVRRFERERQRHPLPQKGSWRADWCSAAVRGERPMARGSASMMRGRRPGSRYYPSPRDRRIGPR